MSKYVDFLKYFLLPMMAVAVLLVSWMFVLSGSLSDSDKAADMQPNPNEIVFTVVQTKPFIDLIQYGPNGSVKEECFLNYDLAKLRDEAPLDIELFCSEGDVIVKVTGIYGLPINPSENGEFEQSESVRIVVELSNTMAEVAAD